MNSSLVSRFLRASVFAGFAGLVGSTACVQDQETLLIERAVWFDDSCSLSASSSDSLAQLTADVSFEGTQLAFGVVVTNNAYTNPGSNTGLDDSEIFMESIDISLSFSGGGLATSGFNVPLPTDSIRGGGSQSFLIQIPADIVDSVRASMSGSPNTVEILEVEVVFNARKTSSVTENGKLGQIQSRAYVFPMNICFGCLASCKTTTECPDGTPNSPEGLICPSSTDWRTTCGYAVGDEVVAEACYSDS